MKTLAVAVSLLCLTGCGGGRGDPQAAIPPPDPLLGTWALTAGSCVVGHTFATGGQYENDLVCQTASGGFGLQAETGSYTVTGSRIVFTIEKDSCAPTASPYYVDYSIQGGRLSLIYTDGVELLMPYTPTGGAVAAFGCWSMGSFTPGPLAPVP